MTKPAIRRATAFLLAGIAAVAVLGWLTARFTEFSSDPLSVLPPHLPEVEARRLYQTHFLDENELVISLRATAAIDLLGKAENLAAYLEERLPRLENRIQFQEPWEKNPAGLGELAAHAWSNAPPEKLRQLAGRLTDEQEVATQIGQSIETLGSAFSFGPEEARLAIDPLELSSLPGLPGGKGRISESIGFGAGDLRVVLIDFPAERTDSGAMGEWLGRVRAAVEEWPAGSVEVTLAGWAPYLVEMTESMRRELLISATFTLSVVLLLFFAVYRTIRPLLALAVSLSVTALATVLLGGVLFGELNGISIGFAAILIALVIDYSVIVYQEQAEPGKKNEGRHSVVRPVVWAAGTTALVFLALNFSALPGLAQLGTLVAVGLVIGAALSLGWFRTLVPEGETKTPRTFGTLSLPPAAAVGTGICLAVGGVVWLAVAKPPEVAGGPDTLLPRHLESVKTFESLRQDLRGESRPMAVLFRADSGAELRKTMEAWRSAVEATCPEVEAFVPVMLWERAPAQARQNRETLREILAKRDEIRRQVAESFENEALAFFDAVFSTWQRRIEGSANMKGEVARQVFDEFFHIDEEKNQYVAKGLLNYRGEGGWPGQTRQKLQKLAASQTGVTLLGWDNLTTVLTRLQRHDSRWVVAPICVILVVLLLIMFRSVKAAGLSLATLSLSGIVLLGLMRLLGIDWNQINLMALPLLLGAGLDYNIHLQFALKRAGGDRERVGRTIGKALLVCGFSTAAGFGSLAGSHHPGLASLGQTCALGILTTMLVSVFLLPGWWKWTRA